jgi:hypothetical protein
VPTYYTYKADVPLLPGQTLGFASDKGYYAAGTPTPTQATRNTTAAPSYIDQPVATPARTQPVAANAAQVAKNTTASPSYIDQPVATPAGTQPVAANAAQVAKNTTAYVNPTQPVAAAQTRPSSANAAQVAKQTTDYPSFDQPGMAKLVATQPTAANADQVARQTTDYPSFDLPATANLVAIQPTAATAAQVAKNTVAFPSDAATSSGYGTAYYTYPFEVPLKLGQTLGFTRGRGYYAVGTLSSLPSGITLNPMQPMKGSSTSPQPGTPKMHPIHPTKAGTPIERADPVRALAGASVVAESQPAKGTIHKPGLTPPQLRLVRKIERVSVDGIHIANPGLTVEAAARAKLPITLALALLAQESFGGRNVWGTDQSSYSIFTGGYDSATGRQYGQTYTYTHTVTEAGYLAFRAQREKTGNTKSQGVGPTMLTDPALQDEADKLGGAWKPLPNMIVGFSSLEQSIAAFQLYRGLVVYNAGTNPSPAGLAAGEKYASEVLAEEKAWAAKLGIPSVQR